MWIFYSSFGVQEMFGAFFFVVVVPYVFVSGVVPILSLTGCVLIFLIKNPSLVIVSS